MADRVERYLGRLDATLEGRVGDERRELLLIEVESHLVDAVRGYEELGLGREEAERSAIKAFGRVEDYVPELVVPGSDETSRVRGFCGATVPCVAFGLTVAVVVICTVISLGAEAAGIVVGGAALLMVLGLVSSRSIVWPAVRGALAGITFVGVIVAIFGTGAMVDGVVHAGIRVGPAAVWQADGRQELSAVAAELQVSESMYRSAELAMSQVKEGGILVSRSDLGYLVPKWREGSWGYRYSEDQGVAIQAWKSEGQGFLEIQRAMYERKRDRYEGLQAMVSAGPERRVGPLFLWLSPAFVGALVLVWVASVAGSGLGAVRRRFERKVRVAR